MKPGTQPERLFRYLQAHPGASSLEIQSRGRPARHGALGMRIRTGHRPDDWTPSVESYARLSTIGGSIPVSAPGPNDASVHAKQKAVSRKAEKA